MSRPVRTLLPTDSSLKARVRRSATWKGRRATSSRRVLPHFIIIGGQRCGTTSLHEALAGHRSIATALRKEIHYFDLHFEREIDWYRAHFPLARNMNGLITFEATPNYLVSADAPHTMRAVVPDVKLIALLRNPVERTHSSWKLRTHDGSDDRPFEKAIEDELAGIERGYDDNDEEQNQWLARAKRWSYMEKSRYNEHLERWFKLFNREQFLILQSERLFENPTEGLAEIQEFLRIDEDPSISLPRINYTAPSAIEPSFRHYLNNYFAPHTEQLSTITDMDFDWS